MPTTAELPVIGSTMPDIALTAPDGSSEQLANLVTGSRAVVYFVRASTCAICAAHAATLTGMAAAGDLKGARVVVVTPGDAKDAARVAGKLPAGTAVYASGTEHAAVGLGTFLTIQHSGTFVVDADGTVLSIRTATIPTASFSRDEVLATLA